MVSGVAYAIMLGYVLTRSRGYFWDEVFHASRANDLATSASFRDWLLDDRTVAPGPLHAQLLFTASGWHGAPLPLVGRLINTGLLGATIAVLAWVQLRIGKRPVAAMAMMMVPMVWVVSGLTLTEPLSFFGATVALAGAVLWSQRESDRSRAAMAFALLASGTAIATATRQTYLAAVPGLWLAAVEKRRDWGGALAGIAVGLVPLALLVAVWHGLVAPQLAYVERGVAPLHAYLAFSLTGVVALLIAPRFYWEHRRVALVGAAAAIIVNGLGRLVEPTTFTSVQRFLGHPAVGHAIEKVAGAVIVAAGAAFIAAMIAALSRSRDRLLWAAALAITGLSVACAGVAQLFSSRYAVMAVPFLIVFLAPWIDFGRWAIARVVCGSGLGLAILHSYYVYAS